MSAARPTFVSTAAALAAAALVTLLLLTLVRTDAPDAAAEPGETSGEGIRVREAALRRTSGAWSLDARIEIDLPRAIRSGLDSGVPLEFVLDVSLREPRRFVPDRTVFTVERRYGLVYYDLTRHYRVRSLDDGTARNYRSLGTALEGLGTLRGVSLGTVDPSAPGDGARPLVGTVALRLDGRALPLPLQSPFGSAWRLPSRPRVWTLAPGDADGIAGMADDGGRTSDNARASLFGGRSL